MRKVFAAIGLMSGWAACASTGPDHAADRTHLTEIRAQLSSTYDSSAWTAVERSALTRAGHRARRDGETLLLTLAGNAEKRLEDNSDACESPGQVDDCVFFSLTAYLPSHHSFLVRQAFYEGGQFLLVNDESGRVTEISGSLRLGADERRFLVIDDDYAYGSGWELQIWRWAGDGAVLEWQRMAGEEPSPHLIDLVRWDREGEILLEMRTEADLYGPETRWGPRLHRVGGEWRLDMDLPH